MERHDGRSDDALRPVKITTGYLKHPPGSALIEVGETRVICAASVEDKVPVFLKDMGEGWITGEYAMIPAATNTRSPRETTRGRPSGRSMEIQRLVGRALRSVVDRKVIGERTIWIDCDVIQADGGTRTSSITGGFVALALALDHLAREGLVRRPALLGSVAAVSVGVVEGRPVVDLDYIEDSAAEVDMNVVRTNDGRYIEIQGTAETTPFRRERLDEMLTLADRAIDRLQEIQREAIGHILDRVLEKR